MNNHESEKLFYASDATSLPKGFEERLGNNLRKKEATVITLDSKWIKIAIAASLLIITCALAINHMGDKKDTVVLAEKDLASGMVLPVEISFNAATNLTGLDFEVSLPEGIKFVSEDQEVENSRSLSWQGDLKKGFNKIPMLMEATEPGRYPIETKIKKGKSASKKTVWIEFL